MKSIKEAVDSMAAEESQSNDVRNSPALPPAEPPSYRIGPALMDILKSIRKELLYPQEKNS
jgi:hypothetical protein